MNVPLTGTRGGSLELSVVLAGQEALFLLDTGAALATINGDLFNAIAARHPVEQRREVAARMADGRIRRLPVYELGTMELPGGCSLGSVEVVVVPGRGRNLLGMNVLSRFAPITLKINPLSVELSGCAGPGVEAVAWSIPREGYMEPSTSFLP